MKPKELDPRTVLAAFVSDRGGLTAAATELGCSKQFIWQLVNGKKAIPASMHAKLGLRRAVVAMEK